MDSHSRDAGRWPLCPREKSGAVRCPGRCACFDVPGDPEPHRYLCELPSVSTDGPNVRRLEWDTRVDFCAKNLPLTTLAAFFARAFPDQVYVPGDRVYATVSTVADGATLAEIATATGLVRRDDGRLRR